MNIVPLTRTCVNTPATTIDRITTDQILDALHSEPDLGYGGFHQGHAESLISHIDEIQLCYDWLQCQDIGKRVNDKSPSSYYLKHAVEFAVGTYVSNGCFIVAAIIAGVPYRRYNWRNPNAGVAVKSDRRNRVLHGRRGLQSPCYAIFKPVLAIAEGA